MISSQTSPTNLLVAKPNLGLSPAAARANRLGLPSVAFVGKAGSGKTTAAVTLEHLFGYGCMSFADPLKDIAQTLWGPEARTDRDKLQRLGVAARDIDPDVWVNQLLKDMKRERVFAPYVVDDCRFENEWYALKAEGFVAVRIEAAEHKRVNRLKASGKWQIFEQLSHETETALDDVQCDYTIFNESTKTFLEDELIDMLIRERRRR